MHVFYELSSTTIIYLYLFLLKKKKEKGFEATHKNMVQKIKISEFIRARSESTNVINQHNYKQQQENIGLSQQGSVTKPSPGIKHVLPSTKALQRSIKGNCNNALCFWKDLKSLNSSEMEPAGCPASGPGKYAWLYKGGNLGSIQFKNLSFACLDC